MAEFFARGNVVDLILALVAIEAAGLWLYWRHTRRGIAPLDLLPNLCAGAFLLLALGVSLRGGDWKATSACLAAAGLAHVADLHRRWRS